MDNWSLEAGGDGPPPVDAKVLSKLTTVHRELILTELVIPDLQQMDSTGNFDRSVLLWLQHGYVMKALADGAQQLVRVKGEGSEDESETERWKRWNEVLSQVTNGVYRAAWPAGGGFDLKQYVDAARAFYGSEASLYAGQLGELAEFIEKALAAGVKPDIERFAREAYRSMARMSGVMQNLEGVGAAGNADAVARMLRLRIEQLYLVTGGPERALAGRELLQAVDDIASAAEQGALLDDAASEATAMVEPWDFDPGLR